MKFFKFYLTLLLVLTGVTFAQAQSDLKSKKLIVVIDDENSDAGIALMNAFEESWKVSKFEFISPDELEKYISNENYAIFLPFTRSYSDDNYKHKYPSMGVVTGGKGCKNINCSKVKFITDFQLKHEYNSKEKQTYVEDYEYLANLIVRYNHFQYSKALENKMEEPQYVGMKMGFMYFYDSKGKLDGKTLYVNKDHIPAKFAKSHNKEMVEMKINRNIKDGAVKLQYVSQEYIQKVLADKDQEALILYNITHFELPDYIFGFVYSASDGKPIARLTTINRTKGWTIYALYVALIIAGTVAFFMFVGK